MNELELRIRVQGMVKQWVNNFMLSNGVSATIMEDALNKVTSELKDAVMQEFIASVTAVPQPEEPIISENNEEDVYDTRGDNSNGFYSLAQFFDNYLAFVKGVKLVHTGDTQPTNPNYCFWIDTSKTNHDTYGERQ